MSFLTIAYYLDGALGVTFFLQSIGFFSSLIERGAKMTFSEFVENFTQLQLYNFGAFISFSLLLLIYKILEKHISMGEDKRRGLKIIAIVILVAILIAFSTIGVRNLANNLISIRTEITLTPTTTSTQSDTPDPIVDDKESIKIVIEQLLIEWDKEIFTDNWDNNITDDYKDRYIDIFFNKDNLADFFSKQNRRIASDISYDDWSESGTVVTATMIINYGDSKLPDYCEYWFKLKKNTETGNWLIDTDKTIATPGKANICPQ